MSEPYYSRDGITLHCCDNVAGMREHVPDASIDLVVTSPPYDSLRVYGGHSWDFEGVAQQLWRVIKPGGVVVWVVADATVNGSETGTSFRQALRFMEIGFRLHDTMIYVKENMPPMNHQRYEQEFEYVFVLSKESPQRFNGLTRMNKRAGERNRMTKRQGGTDGLQESNGFGRPVKPTSLRGNVWPYAVGCGIVTEDIYAHSHPAIFPEALARDHILSWSNEGDIVLDPFAGSCTTLKMAKLMGRRAIGFEINPEYCEIGVKRLAQKVFAFE